MEPHRLPLSTAHPLNEAHRLPFFRMHQPVFSASPATFRGRTRRGVTTPGASTTAAMAIPAGTGTAIVTATLRTAPGRGLVCCGGGLCSGPRFRWPPQLPDRAENGGRQRYVRRRLQADQRDRGPVSRSPAVSQVKRRGTVEESAGCPFGWAALRTPKLVQDVANGFACPR